MRLDRRVADIESESGRLTHFRGATRHDYNELFTSMQVTTIGRATAGLVVTTMAVRRGYGGRWALTPWILKLDIFLLNVGRKRLFSQFRVGKMKFHHFWPPWKKSFPRLQLLRRLTKLATHASERVPVWNENGTRSDKL